MYSTTCTTPKRRIQMSNYETVKELAQGFAKELESTKESMWTLQAEINGLDKKYKVFYDALLGAVDSLSGNTEPVDWDCLIEEAEGAESYAREAQEVSERAHQEAEDLEGNVHELVGNTEQALANCDDTVQSYRGLADTLRRAKEQNSGE